MSHIPLLMHLVLITNGYRSVMSIEYPVSLMKKETKEQIWVKLIIYTVFFADYILHIIYTFSVNLIP